MLSITQLPSETETGVEFVCDVESREQLMVGVAARAHALWLIRKWLIYQTSLLTPDVAECQ